MADKKWIGWDKPLTWVGLLALAAVMVGAYVWRTSKAPPPIFEFDDGTVQGWTAQGLYDDAGQVYDGGLYTVAHGEQHQYPGKFPCPPQCDPLGDKNGSLKLTIAALQPSLPQKNFPPGSAYWQIDLVSPYLSKLFAGKTKFAASVGDMFGIDPGHVRAMLLLGVGSGGQTTWLAPTGAAETVVAKDGWTQLTAEFNVPAGAAVERIKLRIRGDWASYKLYEGGIFLDHVGAVN